MSSMIWSPVTAFNASLKKMAQEFRCTWIDLHALMRDENGELKQEFTNDGLHLTDQAYQLWRTEILKTLAWE